MSDLEVVGGFVILLRGALVGPIPKITPSGCVGSIFGMGTFGRFPCISNRFRFPLSLSQEFRLRIDVDSQSLSTQRPFEVKPSILPHVRLCTLEELGAQPLLHAPGACIGLPRPCSTVVSRKISLPRPRSLRCAAEAHSRAPTGCQVSWKLCARCTLWRAAQGARSTHPRLPSRYRSPSQVPATRMRIASCWPSTPA